jgi:hypothetical protein
MISGKFEGLDVLIHLAAEARDVSPFGNPPENIFKNNIQVLTIILRN